MILISLGSQKFQFDRLLKAVDRLIEEGKITEPVFAQTGASTYEPKHFAYQPFLDREAFTKKMDEADVVIAHGGTGTIIQAVNKGKKVIAVPRLSKYGEHVDDHQKQLVSVFKKMKVICACTDCDRLDEAIKEVRENTYRPFKSNTDRFVSDLEQYIDGLMR